MDTLAQANEQLQRDTTRKFAQLETQHQQQRAGWQEELQGSTQEEIHMTRSHMGRGRVGLGGGDVAAMAPDGGAWFTGPPASDRRAAPTVGTAAGGGCHGEACMGLLD